MVQINFAQKSVTVKIVYYGPGMSGKTTNLEIVHQRAPESNKGDLTSISTDGDRTLFFDFMPLDLGTVAGMRTQFQIYTVPGQVYYNSTRKLVLQGVDGVIFIADSSASMLQENLESLANLEENLREYGKDVGELPMVIQYNKRDLPDAMPVEELEKHLNPGGLPSFEATAASGQGVFPTLKALAARVLDSIHEQTGASSAASAPARPVPGPAPAPPAPIPSPPAQAPAPAPQYAPVGGQAAPQSAPIPLGQAQAAPAPQAPPSAPSPVSGAVPAPAPLSVAPMTGHGDGPGASEGGLRLAPPQPQPHRAPASPAAAAPQAPAPPAPSAPVSASTPAQAARATARAFQGGARPAAPAPASAGRLRPRTAPAPSGSSGTSKATIVTIAVVITAMAAGIAIGGTIFNLI